MEAVLVKHPERRRTLSIIFWLAAVAFAGVQAEASAQESNGCGSGWERHVIPDRLNIIGCDFKQSCDNHDACYGTCLSRAHQVSSPQCEYLRCERSGDLFGSKACDGIRFKRLRVAAAERRAVCDANFMVDIVKLNPENARCTLFSAIYPSAVRVLGSRAFVGINVLDTSWTEEQKLAYASAINDLYRQWSSSRIEQYVNALNGGKVKVDFDKPIAFDPGVGLINVRP